MAFADIYRGKQVLLTGHTGFKGAWLAHWLLELGAKVHGFSLAPPTQPSLFGQLGLATRLNDERNDIRDATAVARSVADAQPDFVFHLAAQSLVRRSYAEPVDTYATNVMGTVNVLEAVRRADRPCTVVCITTDKCYENQDWVHSYREADPLGGYDPYSSSKGAAELVISAYRRSYFNPKRADFSLPPGVRLASARAGNVIGGGDWALDRIVPDCIRALHAGQPIAVRNPNATRPWQHVLEPLSGYLQLGASIHLAVLNSQPSTLNALCSAFNFGPAHESNRTVAELVAEVLKHWPGRWEDQSDPQAPHEAGLLQLAIDKSRLLLRWSPVWSFSTAVKQTVDWYRQVATRRQIAAALMSKQIECYTADAARAGLPWAT